ncbi:uncharacterized protein LOC127433361 isoform X2 [Myxocyprinus asiaticus]|uniref:uncharacterized protein LOC127433361 isoform X2 n=1 Tax=Myxocyprinus asiaticus TaxID=70543 RepID=UPI002222D241|nr:uncharacterized protein LOC127433361 isoform X2 [Myxocyprinus asiaticus]
MERRQREETAEGFTTHQPKLSGTLALRNFTIPRKKRTSGEVLLEHCLEESQDYSLIQSKLRDSRLDMSKDRANMWLWKDVRLVHNEELLRRFSEKRAEMRAKGRHGREMEERFCFFVASDQMTAQIYQHGLLVGSTVQHALGKPSHGVYLFKHVDVALKSTTNILSTTNLLIFKVLYGKVKKIAQSLDLNKTQDPTVGFDCHMFKDAVSHRDSLQQQVLGSSVFLFDFNGNQELSERPRQCLPFAVVSFVSASSFIWTGPTISPVSPTILPVGPVHETVDRFKACTVAERRGKGDTATITFKHFSMPGYFVPDYTPQNVGIEALFQNMENTQSLNPKQHWIPASQDSTPNVDHTALSQSLVAKEEFLCNQRLNTSSANEGYDDKCDTIPQSPSTSKISTIVYSSRLVKDPRLSRRETNQHINCSKAETTFSTLGCEERKCKPVPQNQEENCGFARTVSVPKEPSNMDIKKDQRNKGCCLQSSVNNCGYSSKRKTETLPSMKLFKMKFQKYAEYFRLKEEQRRQKIWSLENMSPEQKQALMDRIHFYEVYFQKYKKGLLSQKVNETQKASSLSEREPKGNLILHTTENAYKQNQSNVSQTKMYDASTDFAHREKCIRNIVNTDIHETNHPDNPKSSSVMLVEKKLDLLPETHRDHVDHSDGLVDSSGKLSELASHSLTNKRVDAQIVQFDPKQSHVPVTRHNIEGKINPKIVCQSELSTSVVEDPVNESTPVVNFAEETSPESALMYTNNITSMEIASCVEVSSCGASENCSLNSTMVVTRALNGQNQKRGTTCTEGFEISAELKMEDNITYRELYTRLQLDQLLASKNGKHIFSVKAYLTPRVMGRPTNTIGKLKKDSKYHCKDIRFWEDLIVTLKDNKTPARTKQTLSLSDRFSKIKGLQKRLTGLMNGRHFSNSKVIQNPETQIASSEEYKKTGAHNCELIQLLAQRYNNAKLHAKYRSLSRQGNKKACIRKQHSALSKVNSLRRTKYFKKKHFWKAKNCMMSTESSHKSVYSKETSDSSNSSSHASETVLTESKDEGPDPHLGILSHTPHADCESQRLCIQGFQETNNYKSLLQDHCSPTISPTNKGLTPKPTEPHSQDSMDTNKKKPTEDAINSTPVMVDEVKQVKTAKNSSTQNKTLITHASMLNDSRTDYRSTIIDKESMLQELTSETISVPVGRAEQKTMKKSMEDNVEASECLNLQECKVSETHSDMTISNAISSHTTNLQINMTPELKVMDTVPDKTEVDICCDVAMDNITINETNASVETYLNFQCLDKGEMLANIPNKSLSVSANKFTYSSVRSSNSEITMAKGQGKALFETSSDSMHCVVEAFKCTSNNVVDLTTDDPVSSGQCENASELTKSNETNLSGISISNTKHASTVIIKENGHLSRPEQNKNCDKDSPETQLISKLRDYLTKFESTVKKQEAVNEDLKERPVAWITLDSTAHKQQLAEKRQYSTVNLPSYMPQRSDTITKGNSSEYPDTSAQTRLIPGSEHVQTGTNVYLLVPAGSKRDRRSSQTRRTNRLVSKKARSTSLTSVSPDSTSSLDTVKHKTSPLALAQVNNRNDAPTENSTNTPNAQFRTQSKNTTRQQNPIICTQDSVNINSLCERKSQLNQSLDTIESIYNGNVSSTFAESEYSVSDISNTLKMADQTTSLTKLGSLQSKCKSMLQHFISSFERDQKVPFNQSFVSRHLILEQYLDHPPAHVDLKYEAVNSFLELQMMMETWQFVENKINFLSGKPTFRSLLYYDSSLYGELYKGEVGFQQQSSLFASFQKVLVQEGYSKLQQYYIAVSSLHQQINASPGTSYYMYLKSKRELLEAEAALRNLHDIKSFFLSVPMAAMINFGDSLESLERVHKVIMAFVETPSDQLPGTFDVGKAEHLSITCRYLQEKAFFIRSCKEMVSKVSWFGIEHLLYDASKVLIWQDMKHGVPSEVLKTYKSSNPQIIFGVTESGVTLVNKVEQPPQSMGGEETPAQKQTNAARKRKGLQLSMSTQPTVAQNLFAEKEAAYKMAKRRVSYPPITPCNINNNGVNPLFKTTPPARVENPTPYYALPQKPSPVHWGMVGSIAVDWNSPNLVPPSKSHAQSEIRSRLLSKKQVTLSRSDQRTSSADIQRAQWPSISAPQATFLEDSVVTCPRIESVKHQQTSTSPRCPVLSKEQVNQFTLAMTKPYPHFPLNTSSVPPPRLSLQNTMMHVPVPGTITAISYPYFLLNGQTFTTGSTSAIDPDARYYPNAI